MAMRRCGEAGVADNAGIPAEGHPAARVEAHAVQLGPAAVSQLAERVVWVDQCDDGRADGDLDVELVEDGAIGTRARDVSSVRRTWEAGSVRPSRSAKVLRQIGSFSCG
jgi:hypothetical protein